MSVLDKDGNEVLAPPQEKPKPVKPHRYTALEILELEMEKVIELSNTTIPFYSWTIEKTTEGDELIRGKFRPSIMSAVCQRLWYPKSLVDEKGISDTWFYDWMLNIYRNGAKDYFGVAIKNVFKDDFRLYHVDQTYSDVKYSTPLPRDDFVIEPHYIPQKNNILKIYLDKDTRKWSVKVIARAHKDITGLIKFQRILFNNI